VTAYAERRDRRPRTVRASTTDVKRLTKKERAEGLALYPVDDTPRPRVRGDCFGGERPCPFVGCRYNLFLDASLRTGGIKLNFPDLELEELADTCALDVADRGPVTLDGTGLLMNLTRERVRQIENTACGKVAAAFPNPYLEEP
jgi:hypothetical protein